MSPALKPGLASAIRGYSVALQTGPLRLKITLPALDTIRHRYGPLVTFDKPLKEIQQLVTIATKENFDAERAPDGTKWAPLKHPRPRRRGRRKGRDKILQDTGTLRASVTSACALSNLNRRTSTSVEWGTNVDYAPAHQFGTRKMVARPFLGVNDRLIDQIDKILDRFEQGLAMRLGA